MQRFRFFSRLLTNSRSTPCRYSSTEPLTTVTQEDGVRRITLNNVKKRSVNNMEDKFVRNALSLEMLTTLKENISNNVNHDLRIIVLSANGPVFSAGHDLKELVSAEDRGKHEKIFGLCSEVMELIQSIEVPVLCKVAGLATAAGCQLVATCDIAVASEKATFCTPGINVGLFCSTPAVALARCVPRKLAMEMLFTADVISAQRALENGLVSQVYPAEKLDEETDKMVEKICRNSRSVLALGKAGFYRQILKDTSSAYRDTSCVMVDNLSMKDAKEGISAFLEKRKPVWTHGTE